MKKIIVILIVTIVVLIGLILFLLFPVSFDRPQITNHKLSVVNESDFNDELSKYDLTIYDIEIETSNFYVLSSSEVRSEELVYETVKFQIGFQYLESANEHYEIFIFFNDVNQRYYYFSPPNDGHEGEVLGYVDYDSVDFHISHLD